MKTRAVQVLVTAMMIAGCSTVAPPDPQLISERIPFIRDGMTSQEEVLFRLGEADNRYEGGRILTYHMCEPRNQKGQLRLSGTRPTDKKGEWQVRFPCERISIYDLVLVFGPEGLLARHSLVLVK